MVKRFPNNELDKLLWKAARATTAADYDEAIKQMRTISVAYVNWLEKTADKVHWAEPFFPGNRHGHLTSNIAELFNKWILEARNMPILGMLEGIRVQLMGWIVERCGLAESEDGKIILSVNRAIQTAVNQFSRCYEMRKSTNDICEVLSSCQDPIAWRRRNTIRSGDYSLKGTVGARDVNTRYDQVESYGLEEM
jgi:hypothetical protein